MWTPSDWGGRVSSDRKPTDGHASAQAGRCQKLAGLWSEPVIKAFRAQIILWQQTRLCPLWLRGEIYVVLCLIVDEESLLCRLFVFVFVFGQKSEK